MPRRAVPVLASLLVALAMVTVGCGAAETEPTKSARSTTSAANVPATAQEAVVPEKWVSIEDCAAVEGILKSLGPGEADARRFLTELNLGRESKIRLEADRTGFAWLGGGENGTGTCTFD